MNKEKVIPKLVIATVGKSTNVFLDGKCISSGIEDLKYSALDENGKLCPTLDMKINVNGFSFESGIGIEEFLEKSTEFERIFRQSASKEKELPEEKEET